MSMAKYPVTRQLLNLVANVPTSQGTAVHEAKETIRLKLATPLQYSETFHSQNVAVEDVEVPDGKEGEDDVVWVSSGNDLSVICEGMPKSMFAFAELLHNVYHGELDEEMTALAGLKSVKGALVDDDVLGGVSPTLLTKMREALRLVASAANQCVPCEQDSEGGLISERSLKRVASNPDDAENVAAQKERAQLWEKAREQRRKFVAVQSMNGKSKAKLDAMYAKMAASKLGPSNRLFVWSADLVTESGPHAWRTDSPPAKSAETNAVLDFMANLRGQGDFAICFDGRMRSVRRHLEQKLSNGDTKSPEEIFVFYASEDNGGSKIFMGGALARSGICEPALLPPADARYEAR